MDDKKSQRIVVIGSGPHSGVSWYMWDKLPEGFSVADYDVAFLNFAALEEQDEGPILDTRLLPKRDQFARLLFSEGEVIVIGSPMLSIRNITGGQFTADWWLPFYLEVVQEFGTEIEICDASFSFYFQHVARWTAFVRERLTPSMSHIEYGQITDLKTEGVTYTIAPVARTRFNEAIGFMVRMELYRSNGSRSIAGPVIWLPRADKLTAHESAELILRMRYNVLVSSLAPDWAEPYSLPKEEIVRGEIMTLDEQLLEIQNQLESARERLAFESRFRALLFESGEVLERLVRDAFRELGATVEERPKDREDGRLIDPDGRQGIIEVKGRTGAAKLSDIRQLHQWVGDAIAEEDWNGKGILVVNAFSNVPVEGRGEPFPVNSARAAERFGQCLLTTTQLFAAIRAKQKGQFNSKKFWNTVFKTNGICKVVDISNAQPAVQSLNEPSQ